MNRADVFIAGAGPAGLAAAIAAASSGFSVIVADAVHPPLHKACGEGLMPDAIAALSKLGIDLESIPSHPFRGIRFLYESLSCEATFPTGHGRGMHRILLSEALLRKAEQLGVRFLWDNPVRGLGRNQVQLSDGFVTAKWIVGADGDNSTIRRLASFPKPAIYSQRIGLRRHFRVHPWTHFVEIHWSDSGQAYVTPTAANEVCIAIVSRRHNASFDSLLAQFSTLSKRLAHAEPLDLPRGCATLHSRVATVTKRNIALIGQASASVDALTGEGLALAFRQAVALADALRQNNRQHYQSEHTRILRLPAFMSRTLLLLDAHRPLRRHVLRAFHTHPDLFQSTLQIHVGGHMPPLAGSHGIVHLGAKILLA